MDTLNIIREIIDLAAERDRLALESMATGAALRCETEAREALSARVETLRDLCDELRAALANERSNVAVLTRELSDLKLRFSDERAECERLREVARQAIEQRDAADGCGFMTRGAILKVAREALNADAEVRAVVRFPSDEALPDQTIVTKLARVCDDPSDGLPIMFALPTQDNCYWQCIFTQDGVEGILTMEILGDQVRDPDEPMSREEILKVAAIAKATGRAVQATCMDHDGMMIGRAEVTDHDDTCRPVRLLWRGANQWRALCCDTECAGIFSLKLV